MTPEQELERRHWVTSVHSNRTREEIHRKRDRWLSQVVQSAATGVPFYRDLFRATGIDPASVRSPADLAQLPVVTRKQIQAESPERLVHEGAEAAQMSETRTSGSSGFPLVIRHSASENMIHMMLKRRVLLEVGLQPRGVLATVIMNLDEEPPRTPGAAFERVVVDCRLEANEILRRLVELQPTTLTGYPSALAHLSIAGDARLVKQVRPELCILGGEVVTSAIRESVLEAFKAPVTSTYASNESRWIAGECEKTGDLHILDDSVVVEILDEKGDPVAEGETGEVVVTGLHGFAQPFIRYRLGDVATQGRSWMSQEGCSCGAPYSTLRNVQGRNIDYLTLPSGLRVSSYVLTLQLVEAAPFIQRYQVVQEDLDRIRMLVIPKRDVSEVEIAEVRTAAHRALGEEVRFDVEIVDQLIREESGKFKLVHSRLNSPR